MINKSESIVASGKQLHLTTLEYDHPMANQVTVAVVAAGLSMIDVMATQRLLNENEDLLPHDKTEALGLEAAGVITEVGSDVVDFEIGDDVIVFTGSYIDHIGCLSKMIVVDATHVMPMPKDVTYKEASSISLNFTVAYLLTEAVRFKITTADKILIHQACGGIGGALIQMIRNINPDVKLYGTASLSKHSHLQEQGVVAIEYGKKGKEYDDILSELLDEEKTSTKATFSVVFDGLGGKHLNKNYNIVAANGALVLYGTTSLITGDKRSYVNIMKLFSDHRGFDINDIKKKNMTLVGFNLAELMKENPKKILSVTRKCHKMYEEGLITLKMDKVFTFANCIDAVRRLTHRFNIGKVVLTPNEGTMDLVHLCGKASNYLISSKSNNVNPLTVDTETL